MGRFYGRDARDYRSRMDAARRSAAQAGPPPPYVPLTDLETLQALREMRSDLADEFEADLRARGLLAA